MEIKNKIIIVTGASEGIGLATAKYLSRNGATVVLAARSADKLKAVEKELLNSLVVPTDLRRPEDIIRLIDRTMAKFGRIDILINNAGQGIYGKLEDIDISQFQEVMELNVFAVARMMQAIIPIMRKQGGGMILNVSSQVSKMFIPGLSAYAATKYALNAISLTARQELVPDHIVVSVIHPRMTATRFGASAINARRDERVSGGSATASGMTIDTPEQVAEKIGGLIMSEEAEALMP